MKTISKTLLAAAVSALPLGAIAEINIDFESNSGYKSTGIYDVWEESPFRTGVLKGNLAVTANPDTEVNEMLGEAPNPSAKVLGAQRSRFGSNRFGVRIDLEETFELTPTLKYVHVMLYTPKSGRAMLVGLGSRRERKDQNPYCEQFWQLPSNNIEPGKWCDAVFAVKGAGGIDIRSLVVIPDLESPHNLTEDFLFYVDNIEVNTSAVPRIVHEYYPVIGSQASSPMTRTDRVTNSIAITVDGEKQTAAIAQQTNKLLYQDLTGTTFYAQPGKSITPEIGYTNNWMHAYCYIDFNNDGKFNSVINSDGTPADGSELVSYNAYATDGTTYRNSLGQTAQAGPNSGTSGKMPAFTLPADIKPGMYRMRMKLDWNSIDPMGNPGDAEGKNIINDNGGMIADVMLCICGPTVTVNDFQLNGEVLTADNGKLNSYQAEYNKAFTIKMAPEKGFHHDGVDLKIGFNLDGEATDKYGNPQYAETYIPGYMFDDNSLYTIPAGKMRGNVLINGRMIEDGSTIPVSSAYPINFPEDLQVTRTDRKLNSITLATSGDDSNVTIDIPTKNVYQNHVGTEVAVCAGETITPTVSYTGNSMHTYWYVDLDEDGRFSNTLAADGTPLGELLSYSCFSGRNSLGQETATSLKPSEVNHPFTIPATTAPGLYRCRFKIDWNDIDPGGHYGQGSNDIDANGGYIVDFLIHVHATRTPVSATVAPQNGNLLTTVGNHAIGATAYSAPYAQALTIKGTTDNGMTVKRLNARYGYRLDSGATFLGHTYWHETAIEPDANGVLTLPASIMSRPVVLTGEFEQSGINEITAAGSGADIIYDLRGVRVDRPARGIYITNGKKVVVK